MTIGFVGLGKMGLNLALNAQEHGHRVIGTDLNEASRRKAQEAGIESETTLASLIQRLAPPRIIWVMVPAGEAVDGVMVELTQLLSSGDTVIDAGNSHFRDSLNHHQQLKERQIGFLDVGTSGGIAGARQGACFMVGGEPEVAERVAPLLQQMAVEGGYLYAGGPGAGHFLKMVHNGIEYGMMQAIGEGFAVLEGSPYSYDLAKVAHCFNHGSVVRSWLMKLCEQAFQKSPHLDEIADVMHSSGEGQWTVEEALHERVPVPVIALSLLMRFRSEEKSSFSGKVVAALRNEFGGHPVDRVEPSDR